MPRSSKTILEQVDDLYPEFTATVDGLTIEQLEKRLSDYAKNRDEVEESKKSDEELKAIALQKSEMEAPYRETLKAINLKSKYIVSRIKEKGGQ